MAYYYLFPEKDTTIYSHTSREFLNTGIDEVLTLRDEPSSTDLNYYPSRILIQFKDSDIRSVITKIGNNFSSSLQLFSTEHKSKRWKKARKLVEKMNKKYEGYKVYVIDDCVKGKCDDRILYGIPEEESFSVKL